MTPKLTISLDKKDWDKLQVEIEVLRQRADAKTPELRRLAGELLNPLINRLMDGMSQPVHPMDMGKLLLRHRDYFIENLTKLPLDTAKPPV